MNGVPDQRYFTRVAGETGFRAGPLETVFRLVQLLGRIDGRFGDEVSLRGGTALNLLHLDVPRLSVDIDLDYLGAADPEEAQQRRPELLAELEALSQEAGYEVKPERASYAMAHLRLAYADSSGRPAQLELDVNFLDRVPALAPERLPVRHPFGDDLPESEMQTFALAELAAAKTIALVRRALARDLRRGNARRAPGDGRRAAHDRDRRSRSRLPAALADRYSAAIVDRIRSVRWRSEVLALVRRPIPVTLEAARVTAAAFIKRATNFTDDQRAFLRLLEAGELRAELLGDERDRIAANPALLWRLRVGAERLEER